MAGATTLHDVHTEEKASWIPMIAIALGQVIMSFNVASLPVALGGMVESFQVPPTTVATGIVAYGMLVAGFVMLGAKLVVVGFGYWGAKHVRVLSSTPGVAVTVVDFAFVEKKVHYQ